MEYLILGAGPAGVTAADILSRKIPGARISLVGGEKEKPYSRMAIPYYLMDKIDESGTLLKRDSSFLKGRGINYLNHSKAKSIEPGQKRVILEDDTRLSYDKLLIASGSKPFKPDVPGFDLPGIHHCWTLDDARAIHKKAVSGSKVTLIGAGFIGSIILDALAQKGVELTVIESGDRMVPRMLNSTSGKLLKKWCESKGLTVHTSTTVTKIKSEDGGSEGNFKIYLDHEDRGVASEHYSDLIIVATGVKPNIGFLENSGLEIQDGIVVNRYLETNIDGVYAAGDVAQGTDNFGVSKVHAIHPTAAEHGRLAALNMSGTKTPYQGSLSMNVLETLGLISCTFGAWDGTGGESSESLRSESYNYLKLEFQGDKLIGAISLGLREQIGTLRGLIQSGIKLGRWKEVLLKEPNRFVEAYVATIKL